jgi:predicted transcriptional regulator
MTERRQKDLASSLQTLGGQYDNRIIELDIHQGRDETLQKLKALASAPRLRILEYLTHPSRLCNLTELAEALGMNLATVTMHINILEEAGLILCEHIPGERGTQRVCGCFFNWLNVHVTPKPSTDAGQLLEHTIPIGSYVSFDITPTCGLFGETRQIGSYDDPKSFYEAERVYAQLLWFHSGYVEYVISHRLPQGADIESLSLSMEICSEAPKHHDDWPSDISVWVNNVELGSWTSPGDFGGIRGNLTPAWQPADTTQFGLLKTWQVTGKDCHIDGVKASEVNLEQLNLLAKPFVTIRVGVKEDARHVGGVNIFGSRFGNYPQDIVLRIRYH